MGLLLAPVFHFHQKNVRNFPIKGIWLRILDLAIWLAAIPLVFWVLLRTNQGEVRFYLFLGLLVGAGLYFFYLASRFNYSLESMSVLVGKAVCRMGLLLSVPKRWLINRFTPPSPPPAA
ncbi:MAG: hypothetical protein GX825_07515 [Syntrophomonadaceae bacterium]|nr:hypothetical protein [Syntrophomonadaceae bacterium]